MLALSELLGLLGFEFNAFFVAESLSILGPDLNFVTFVLGQVGVDALL